MGLLALLDPRVRLDPQGRRANLVLLARKGKPGLLASLVHKALQARTGQMAWLGKLGLWGQWGLQEYQVRLGRKVSKVSEGYKGTSGSQASRVQLVLWGQRVRRGLKGRLGPKVRRALLGMTGLREALQVRKENPVCPGQTAFMELPVQLGRKVRQVRLVRLVHRASLVRRALQAT